jgi:hypothetical protein
MWVPPVYLAGGDQKAGSFRAEATKTAAKVPQNHRNHPEATRIGRSYGESRLSPHSPDDIARSM